MMTFQIYLIPYQIWINNFFMRFLFLASGVWNRPCDDLWCNWQVHWNEQITQVDGWKSAIIINTRKNIVLNCRKGQLILKVWIWSRSLMECCNTPMLINGIKDDPLLLYPVDAESEHPNHLGDRHSSWMKMLQRAFEQDFIRTPRPLQTAALGAAHFLHPFQFITPSPTCIILPATHSLLSLEANLLVEAFWLHLPFKSCRLELDIWSRLHSSIAGALPVFLLLWWAAQL